MLPQKIKSGSDDERIEITHEILEKKYKKCKISNKVVFEYSG